MPITSPPPLWGLTQALTDTPNDPSGAPSNQLDAVIQRLNMYKDDRMQNAKRDAAYPSTPNDMKPEDAAFLSQLMMMVDQSQRSRGLQRNWDMMKQMIETPGGVTYIPGTHKGKFGPWM